VEQNYNSYGRDQINIPQPEIVNINVSSQAEKSRDSVLRKLLEVVKGEVGDRLAQSLHRVVGASLINLTKESQPEQVRSPWQMELWQERQPPQLLPPETTIAQVFDQAEVNRKLLILGEPGSGKTTTMLELARELVQRAEATVDQPIPVLLNLSSWKPPQDGKQDPFLPWLLAELASPPYSIPKHLSKTWLATSHLLPFLDGLDEVDPQYQEACATAINQWLISDLEQRPVGLVVCCRFQEYEKVVRKSLFLNIAIVLQPLADIQIQNYLGQLGLDHVWQSVQNHETLKNLLTKPLFLSIFGFLSINNQFNIAEWKNYVTEAAQCEYLLDQYWNATMTRELVSIQERDQERIYSKTYQKRYLPETEYVKRALIFIAKGLKYTQAEELLIETIQPHWLTSENHIKAYLFLYLAIMIPATMLAVILIASFIGKYIIFLFAFPIPFLSISHISPIQKIRIFEFSTVLLKTNPFSSKAIRDMVEAGTLVRFVAYSIAVIVFLFNKFISPSLAYAIIIGVLGISGNFLVKSVITIFRGEIEVYSTANQSIKSTLKNIILLCFIIIPFCSVLGYSLLWRLSVFIEISFEKQIFVAFIIYVIWLILLGGGGKALIQHIALRLVMWWNDYAPFRYDRLLNYATERSLLQRIGGRYRFMHKLLQEHFAAMNLEP